MPIFSQNDISENVFGWSYSELNISRINVVGIGKGNQASGRINGDSEIISASEGASNNTSSLGELNFCSFTATRQQGKEPRANANSAGIRED